MACHRGSSGCERAGDGDSRGQWFPKDRGSGGCQMDIVVQGLDTQEERCNTESKINQAVSSRSGDY